MSDNVEVESEGANDISVHSLAVFLDWVAKHQRRVDELNDSLLDDNLLTLYFRGVRSCDYMLIPSIYRNGWIENEDIVFNECLCRNPQDFTGEKTTFDKLVKMQHYGVPTRLLDITTNPLVALYFACEAGSTKASVGKVYVFYVSAKAIKYSESNTVAAVSNLAVRPYGEMDIHDAALSERKKYIDACEKANSQADIGEADRLYHAFIDAFNDCGNVGRLVYSIQNEKPGFLPWIRKEHLESVWAVKPKLNNNRIVRQDGAFLLFGILGSKEVPLSIVSLQWAQKCLSDIDQKISERLNNLEYIDGNLYTSGDDVRMHLFPDPQLETLNEEEELWETVKKAEDSRMGDYYFGEEGASRTKAKMSYHQLESLMFLSMRVAKARFMENVWRNDALIFCDSVKVDSKTDITKEIAILGMTRDKLFPELDDVAEYLKDKYFKKKAGN